MWRPWHIVGITSFCTALALFGDATLYAVLPVQYAAVGVTTLQVGWLLSVNRLVRLPLNLPSGWLVHRWGPKIPYIAGLIMGAISTLGYGLCEGIGAFLFLRALWGVAWTCVAVSGYTMVLNAGDKNTHGRYASSYHSFSFFGGSVGAMLGGILADRWGLASAMVILGLCTCVGCLIALALPGARGYDTAVQHALSDRVSLRLRLRASWQALRGLQARIWLILWLNFVHRFFFAGVFYSVFGFYLRYTFGESLRLGPLAVGVASLTGTLLFVRNVATVLISPSMGYLSDRLRDRRRVLALGEAAGVMGLAALAWARTPYPILAGVLLIASAYGLVPSILVAWMGDLSEPKRRGFAVAGFQTMGDLGSGLGPLVAYPLIDWLGIRMVFTLAALSLLVTIPLVMRTRQGVRLPTSAIVP